MRVPSYHVVQMEVHDQLISISRLLHVRVGLGSAHGQYHGTALERAVDAAIDILVGACNELVWGRAELPADAPPIEPFGVCVRVIVYPTLNRYSVRIFSLRSRQVGLSHHYRWRVGDTQFLLNWWRKEQISINDVAMNILYLNCLHGAEEGVLAILQNYAAVDPVVFTQTMQFCS
jgi:hypothetical protein